MSKTLNIGFSLKNFDNDVTVNSSFFIFTGFVSFLC